MNEITHIARPTTKSVTRWSEPSLSDKLSALLDHPMTLAQMPVIGEKSASALRAYIAALTPPTAQMQDIENMLGKLSLALPKAQFSEAEASQRMDLYWQALRHHASPDLHAAFGSILRTCKFFPTISEIEDAIRPHRAKRISRQNRAEMLVMKHEREWLPPATDLADEREVAAVLSSVDKRV